MVSIKPGLSYMNHFPVSNKHDFRNTVDHHGVTEGQVSDCSMEGSVGSVWRIPDSTNFGIILQFRQHDDLPHLIHEVRQENLEFPTKTRKSWNLYFSFRQNGSPDLTYADFIIVQSVWGMTQGVFMPLSGFISRLIGARCAMLLGCFIFSSGAALTYFTLDMGLVSYMINILR